MKMRSNRLPKPKLQFTIVLSFLTVGMVCILVQFAITNGALIDLAKEISTSRLTSLRITEIAVETLLVSAGLLIPLTLLVGIVATFQVAGPIKRIESYLESIAAGEKPGPCRIREEDEFQDLCRLINEAVRRLEQGPRAPRSSISSRRNGLPSGVRRGVEVYLKSASVLDCQS